MSKSCPLDPLIVARRARRDGAFTVVTQCRQRVAECEATCARIQARIDALEQERRSGRERMSAIAAAGGSPLELGRVDDRLGLLALRVGEVCAELQAAERGLEVARNDLAEALTVFFKAEAKLDALNEQKATWLREMAQRHELREEAMTDDLIVHRVANAR
jgi:flagellar export protein FliJ